MRQNTLKLSLIILLIVITQTTLQTLTLSTLAQDEEIFTLRSQTPIIPHHEDDRGIDGGAIVFHDGLFHMFHNGFRTWPGESVVRYSTSTDGINWELASEEPVFTTAEVDYAEVMVGVSSAMVLEDGTWVLYFFTWQTLSIQFGPGEIGRTTATNPMGPWTPDPAPILIQGSEGEWDSGQLSIPSVVVDENGGYRMYYTASDDAGFMQIGMATSNDGVEWRKYDDPATTESPYAESDPVIFAGESGEWDQNAAYQPNVVHTPDGWIMVYKSFGNGSSQVGIATSEDGVAWSKFEANPIILSSDYPGGGGFGLPELIYHDETYWLYIPAGTSSSSDLFLAMHDGALFETPASSE